MKKRAILLLAAFTATVVIAIAAVRWKDLAVRYQVFRLSGNPQLQDAWLERPADSIQGRAVRTYFRERPGELIRGFLRTMRFVCDQKEVDRRPPHLKDFEGQDRYRFYRDVWAFNPSTSVWRRLDNIPRSRQECAGVALPVGEKRP